MSYFGNEIYDSKNKNLKAEYQHWQSWRATQRLKNQTEKSSYKHNANGQRDDTYEIKVHGHDGCIQKLKIHIMGFPERENRRTERKK